MKLTIERAAALAAMNRVASVIPDKTTIPILTHVLIDAQSDGTVIFRGNSMDIEAISRAEAMVQTAGAITVPADAFHQILKNAAEGADMLFEIEHAPTRLNIKSGRSRFKLATLPAEDYPAFGAEKWEAEFDILGAKLADMLDRTRFAAASVGDTAKRFLSGVHLAAIGSELHAVAMQGYQLAFIRTDRPDGWDTDFGIIIPHALLDQLLSALSTVKDASIHVCVSRGKIALTTPAMEISGRLLDGQYVDYVKIMERFSAVPCSVTVGISPLKAALKRVSAVSPPKDRAVKLSIGDGALSITARGNDGEAEDDITAESDGTEHDLGFNADYLAQALSNLVGDTVKIAYSTTDGGVQFTTPDDFDTVIYVGQRKV